MLPDTGLQPIPGHTLTQRLGDGAFGDVWEAVGPGDRRVALKFLDCRKRSASMVAAEVRILRGLTSLQHPNIIPLYGVHAWGQFVILSMERADGNLEDLRQSYLAKTASPIPTARSMPRAAAFSRPSVTSLLRGLMSG